MHRVTPRMPGPAGAPTITLLFPCLCTLFLLCRVGVAGEADQPGATAEAEPFAVIVTVEEGAAVARGRRAPVAVRLVTSPPAGGNAALTATTALEAPPGRFFLLRRGDEYAAVKITRSAEHKSADYDWYYQKAGGSYVIGNWPEKGSGRAYEGGEGLNWCDPATTPRRIRCGPLSVEWSAGNYVYLSGPQGAAEVEMAMTPWTRLEQVDIGDPGLVWLRYSGTSIKPLPVQTFWFVLTEIVSPAIWLVVLAAAVLGFRRSKEWPRAVALVGAGVVVFASLGNAIVSHAMRQGWNLPSGLFGAWAIICAFLTFSGAAAFATGYFATAWLNRRTGASIAGGEDGGRVDHSP